MVKVSEVPEKNNQYETMEDFKLSPVVIANRSYWPIDGQENPVLKVCNSFYYPAEEFACKLSLTD